VSLFGSVGTGAMALVAVSWLVISFTEPSPRRTRVEWLSACGLYVALLSLFGSLLTRAHEAGNTFGSVAFGFLLLLFGIGLVLALAKLLRSLAGEAASQGSTTH
jgi:hypothetical protein